jgi:hypothetical protein
MLSGVLTSATKAVCKDESAACTGVALMLAIFMFLPVYAQG